MTLREDIELLLHDIAFGHSFCSHTTDDHCVVCRGSEQRQPPYHIEHKDHCILNVARRLLDRLEAGEGLESAEEVKRLKKELGL